MNKYYFEIVNAWTGNRKRFVCVEAVSEKQAEKICYTNFSRKWFVACITWDNDIPQFYRNSKFNITWKVKFISKKTILENRLFSAKLRGNSLAS